MPKSWGSVSSTLPKFSIGNQRRAGVRGSSPRTSQNQAQSLLCRDACIFWKERPELLSRFPCQESHCTITNSLPELQSHLCLGLCNLPLRGFSLTLCWMRFSSDCLWEHLGSNANTVLPLNSVSKKRCPKAEVELERPTPSPSSAPAPATCS